MELNRSYCIDVLPSNIEDKMIKNRKKYII